MRSFLAALQFLTVIPVPARLEEDDFRRAPAWFPVVGLLIGALTALGDSVFAQAGFSGPLPGLLAIGLLAALSGGLHLDGLADTADGFLSARPRERVLEIMRDSRIGTMGVLALIFVLAIKVAAVGELTNAARCRALLLAPLAGRAMQVVIMSMLPYARQRSGGLATMFLRPNLPNYALWAGASLSVAAMVLFGLRAGAMCLGATAVAATLVSLWSFRRIGGFTGDTLGAASEIVEVAVLLAARAY